jgi:hypothetical protein
MAILNLDGHVFFKIKQGGFNSQNFLSFLKEYTKWYRQRNHNRIIILADNATIHRVNDIF